MTFYAHPCPPRPTPLLLPLRSALLYKIVRTPSWLAGAFILVFEGPTPQPEKGLPLNLLRVPNGWRQEQQDFWIVGWIQMTDSGERNLRHTFALSRGCSLGPSGYLDFIYPCGLLLNSNCFGWINSVIGLLALLGRPFFVPVNAKNGVKYGLPKYRPPALPFMATHISSKV